MNYVDGVVQEALEEMRTRSRKRIYQTDFDAWAADMLGRKYYEKMRMMNDVVLNAPGGRTRTAIKSANGCGKSMWLADWETYWVTVWPPEDVLVAATATGRDQIEQVVFKYLKDNYGYMSTEHLRKTAAGIPSEPPIGWINESLEWKYRKPDGSGNENLVFGKRPADQDIVSSFQGRRKRRTLVGFDEAGGLPNDLFTAGEAIATGVNSRQIAIGNPDRRGTEFWRIFNDPQQSEEWNALTVSAYDLPTYTGEIVYPGEPEKQSLMLEGLTAKSWIFHKERVWKIGGVIEPDEDQEYALRNKTGKPNAVFMAKVLGEFPGDTDNSVFPQEYLDRARDTHIDSSDYIWVGVDVAGMGSDESVAYVNRGGRVRVFDQEITYMDGNQKRTTSGTWTKEDEVSSARRAHAIAMHVGADQLRIDGVGIGSGVYRMLERLDEFSDGQYDLFGILGSNSSPDKHEWSRMRDYNHFSLMEQMREGKIDLDPEDKVLFDQLLSCTYSLLNGVKKVTKKEDMRSEMHGSPDRMDALIYATTIIDPDMDGPRPGDVVTYDPASWEMEWDLNGAGMPM